jgi:amino-acid N-acetyltransferase
MDRMNKITIHPAGPADLAGVHALLVAAALPTDGVDIAMEILLVAKHGEQVVGAAAVEKHDKQGLLRSVVVAPSARSTGIGFRLVNEALRQAAEAGLEEVGLLTEDAAGYFERFGFRVIDRSAVRGPIVESLEFTDLCPSCATSMWLDLSSKSSQ